MTESIAANLNKPYKKNLPLLPILGSFLFSSLYFIATLFYPGGSQLNPHSIGFSWTNNYWCNLLDGKAINGHPNSAQPVAWIAMFVLCFTLAFFWWIFPGYTTLRRYTKTMIQVSGLLAMGAGFLLFTRIDHDLITNLASLLGLIATAGTFAGLYKNGWKALLLFGLVNILLVIANNFLYYNEAYISYLPLVQKITFASFLAWISCICFRMYRSDYHQID